MRQQVVWAVAAACLLVIAVVAFGPAGLALSQQRGEKVTNKIVKSDNEWRKLLTPEQYRVTREKGTETPFTGKYWKFKEDGTYLCVACGQALFSSGTKYDAGCGWPSFWQPVDSVRIDEKADRSHGMSRTEVQCSRCGAHLGHVFPDGPQPTGLRYCINSAALTFEGDSTAAKAGEKQGSR